jgi:microcystin-dependent protein
MAGTINLALTQQQNELGEPLANGRLYFYVAGTSTPQDAFQDSDLTIEHPNPITLDAAGRVPMFYLADGQIKIRLTDENGVTQLNADNLLVIGASSGEGGGGSVDDTRLWQTGDLKHRYGTGAHSGWVRSNGRTIGSATSGATERANADTEELFLYLWLADSNLSVSGGRGVSGAADWAANKTIALPDWRGRVIAGMDDMGASAASVLTSSYFGGDGTVLGTAGGSQSHTLTEAQLAAHDHVANVTDPAHAHTYTTHTALTGLNGGSGSTNSGEGSGSTASNTTGISVDIEDAGSGQAHNNVQPTRVATIYVKL